MKYITLEEFYGFVVKAQVTSLTEGKGGEPDMTVLESVNSDVVSEISGFLRGLYRLPLPEPVDPIIRTITGDLMKFRLWTRRDSQSGTESVFKLYSVTISKLKDIQARKILLDAPGVGNAAGSVSEGSVQSWTPAQKFKNHFTGFDQAGPGSEY